VSYDGFYGGCVTYAATAFNMLLLRSRCGSYGLCAVLTDSVEGKIRFFRAGIINCIFFFIYGEAINSGGFLPAASFLS